MNLLRKALFIYKHYAIITRILFIIQVIRKIDKLRNNFIVRKAIKLTSS